MFTDFDKFWCLKQRNLQPHSVYKYIYVTVFTNLISQLFYGIRITTLQTSPQCL